MELQRLQEDGKKSKGEILGKINSILSENENVSLENTKLKVISSFVKSVDCLFVLKIILAIHFKLFRCSSFQMVAHEKGFFFSLQGIQSISFISYSLFHPSPLFAFEE